MSWVKDLSGLEGINTELKLVGTVITCVAAALIGFAGYFLSKKPDGFVEELAERVIEMETGYDFDLTPGSPEKD